IAGIGYGINRVIADRFIFSMGLDFTLTTTGIGHHRGLLSDGYDFSDEFAYFSIEDGDSEANREVMLNAASGRVFLHCLMNFKLGFGILL
ncbi:MAG: hypothetical protein ACPF9D_10645, partial [Owenweeksia sp.]